MSALEITGIVLSTVGLALALGAIAFLAYQSRCGRRIDVLAVNSSSINSVQAPLRSSNQTQMRV
jgi:hypothetical protein